MSGCEIEKPPAGAIRNNPNGLRDASRLVLTNEGNGISGINPKTCGATKIKHKYWLV
jgi:hypothetical protein